MTKKRWGKRGIGEFNARMKSRDAKREKWGYLHMFINRDETTLLACPARARGATKRIASSEAIPMDR